MSCYFNIPSTVKKIVGLQAVMWMTGASQQQKTTATMTIDSYSPLGAEAPIFNEEFSASSVAGEQRKTIARKIDRSLNNEFTYRVSVHFRVPWVQGGSSGSLEDIKLMIVE
jgi:hypothetical protein